MRYIKTGVLACVGFLLAGCAGTFSGSKTAYLHDGGSVPAPRSTGTAVLKHEKQYFPADTKGIGQHYQAPSKLPPVSHMSKIELTGPGASVLAVRSKLPEVWHELAAVLPKTPYRIMDKDETMHSYFVADKQKTGGKLTKVTPIYRLALSGKGPVTELHLVDQNNAELDATIAHRIMSAIEKKYI